MSSWPVPPPEVEDADPPSGWTNPDAPVATTTERDGSIWLHEKGEVRRVAPPGTDHHTVRFGARALPVVDMLLRRLRDDPVDPQQEALHDLVEEVLDLADGDDIALLMAQAFAGRVGLEKAVEEGEQQAVLWRSLVDVLDTAVHRAQQANRSDAGREEIDAAVARWREQGEQGPS